MKLTPTLALRRVKVKVSADVVSLSLSMLSELSVVESSHSLLNVAGSEYSRCIIHSELVRCNPSWKKTRIISSKFSQQETRYSSRSYNVFQTRECKMGTDPDPPPTGTHLKGSFKTYIRVCVCLFVYFHHRQIVHPNLSIFESKICFRRNFTWKVHHLTWELIKQVFGLF